MSRAIRFGVRRWISWVVLAILAVALIGGCFIATWLVRSVIVPLNTLANLLGRTGR